MSEGAEGTGLRLERGERGERATEQLSPSLSNGANLECLFILSVRSLFGSSVVLSIWFSFLEYLFPYYLNQFFYDLMTIDYILFPFYQ